jgi:hypothetical protein
MYNAMQGNRAQWKKTNQQGLQTKHPPDLLPTLNRVPHHKTYAQTHRQPNTCTDQLQRGIETAQVR